MILIIVIVLLGFLHRYQKTGIPIPESKLSGQKSDFIA